MSKFRILVAAACLIAASAASAAPAPAADSYSCVVEYVGRAGIQLIQQPRLVEVKATSEAQAEAVATSQARRNLPKIATGVQVGCWQN